MGGTLAPPAKNSKQRSAPRRKISVTLDSVDILTSAALPGRLAALDIGITSPDAARAGVDCCHAMYCRNNAERMVLAANNADARLRRAGCGIFYADGHPLNFSCLQPGFSQTNQRAELLAIILALRRDNRSLEVRTDSQYCFDGATSWQKWRYHGSDTGQ